VYDIELCRRFPKFEAIKLCQNSRIDDLQICLNQDDPGKNKHNYRIKIMVMVYFSLCSVSFVLIGEYIQYSPLINFRLIIPSNIHLQCLCSTKNEKKQHNEGNMALRLFLF
jgi:hypothetical protein